MGTSTESFGADSDSGNCDGIERRELEWGSWAVNRGSVVKDRPNERLVQGEKYSSGASYQCMNEVFEDVESAKTFWL